MPTINEIIQKCFKDAGIDNKSSHKLDYLTGILITRINAHIEQLRTDHGKEIVTGLIESGFEFGLGEEIASQVMQLCAKNGIIPKK